MGIQLLRLGLITALTMAIFSPAQQELRSDAGANTCGAWHVSDDSAQEAQPERDGQPHRDLGEHLPQISSTLKRRNLHGWIA